ncbi:putative ribonuclease H-like domain-containing protein [Tanacetum coccineum]
MCDKKNSVLSTDTECVVLSPDFKLTDESHVLLKVPRKDNMYSVDLKNVIPQGGLTFLFEKATPNGSNIWHRRLGHVNFKTMKKLVRGSLVRGLPSKLFEINQTCVACQKGKQHRASWNQSNGNVGTKACDDAGKASMEMGPGKDYILLPLWTQDPPFSSSLKDSPNAGFKPSEEREMKDAEDPGNEGGIPSIKEPRINQEKNASVNSTNNINIVSLTVNAASIKDKAVDENIVYGCADDPNIPDLEEIGRFSDAENDDSRADINNLDTYFQVNLIPTTRIHKDHPPNQFIGDLQSAAQTRHMTKNFEEYRTQKGSSSTEGSKLDRGYARRASTIQAIRSLDFARLVAQWYTQEEGIDYDKVFAPVAKIEAIRLFLAYASFKDFVVYQMDVKSAFLYGKIKEEVYVCQPLCFEDPDFPDRVYKVENALYDLHQAPKAWYETLSTYLLENRFQRVQIDKTLFIKRDQGDILIVHVYVDDIIFRSTKKKLCTDFKKMMHKKFQMSSMGELTFLGLQVK